jgi:hypothetical protein
MLIQGTVLSISNAPHLARRIKELEAAFVGLNWQVKHLTAENETLRDQVKHYQHLILLEGKERKKLSKERTKKIKTRRGWKPNG